METTPADTSHSVNSSCLMLVSDKDITSLGDAICAENTETPIEHNHSFEQFCQTVQQCLSIDVRHPEIDDMKSAVEEFLIRLLNVNGNAVNEMPLLSVGGLVPCGSMAENTSNWKFDRALGHDHYIEFDFLAVLNNKIINDSEFVKGCNGFLRVKPSNIADKDLTSLCSKYHGGLLDASLTRERFNQWNFDSLLKLCDCMHDKVLCRRDLDFKKMHIKDDVQYCEKCHVKKETGFVRLATRNELFTDFLPSCFLVMKWTSTIRSLPLVRMFLETSQDVLDSVYILVDLLPAIELPVNARYRATVYGQDNTQSDLKGPIYLVPKTCSRSHFTCWKVSNCLNEIQLLSNIDETHKRAFVVAKYIADRFKGFHLTEQAINSYTVKTSLLHHCTNCPTPRNIQGCVVSVLRYLSLCIRKQSLLNFSNGCNLLDCLQDTCISESKYLCVLLGDNLWSICDTLTSLSLVDGQPLSSREVLSRLNFIIDCYKNARDMTFESNFEKFYIVDRERLQAQIESNVCRV